MNNYQSHRACRCSSFQWCHHRDRRSYQGCAECWKGSPRHCWNCRILLRKSAHTRSAVNNSVLHFLFWIYEIVVTSVMCPSVQVTLCPGSLQERGGSIRPALLRRCRWPSRPAMGPQIMATSLESRFCQVGISTVASGFVRNLTLIDSFELAKILFTFFFLTEPKAFHS